MKVIPKDVRYARKCYFCGRSHNNKNPVEFQLDVQETRIPEAEWEDFLDEFDGPYCFFEIVTVE